jgi:hypothetical protein
MKESLGSSLDDCKNCVQLWADFNVHTGAESFFKLLKSVSPREYDIRLNYRADASPDVFAGFAFVLSGGRRWPGDPIN